MRKDTSIASSILLLRFLHGYYPNEVAKLASRTRSAIDGLLKSARSDLKKYITELPFECFEDRFERARSYDSSLDRLADVFGVRKILFDARKGRCFQAVELQALYSTANSKLSRRDLSHLVSCPTCLDLANNMLDLPLLRDRSPIDVLQRIPMVLSSCLIITNFIFDWSGLLHDGLNL
jgi:hypothetical protein